MNNSPESAKIIEQIKKASNILVAVNQNPTVDELASALGLTLMLNKNDHRAVAVFSGEIPNVLYFLKPEKTFDRNVDGLRDFIIALDPKKADYLRYKVEDDLVKIFITPNNTVITPKDLNFSQGDYNIDLVIAIGVTKKDNLDKALSGHGRILHNAFVASVTIGETKSQLGSVNWHDSKAVSFSQLVGTLPPQVDRLYQDEKDFEPAMDKTVATALLTALVATTERFSNKKTTPDVMTLAAELMAQGANQQLIASELDSQEPGQKPSSGKTKLDQDKEVGVQIDKKDKAEDDKSKDDESADEAKEDSKADEAKKSEKANQKSDPEKEAKTDDDLDQDKGSEAGEADVDESEEQPAPKEEPQEAVSKTESAPEKKIDDKGESKPKSDDSGVKPTASIAADGALDLTEFNPDGQRAPKRRGSKGPKKAVSEDRLNKLKPAQPAAKVEDAEGQANNSDQLTENERALAAMAAEGKRAEDLDEFSKDYIETKRRQTADDLTRQLGEAIQTPPPAPVVPPVEEDLARADQTIEGEVDQLSARLQQQLEASEKRFQGATSDQVEVPSLDFQMSELPDLPAAVPAAPPVVPPTPPVAPAAPAPVAPPPTAPVVAPAQADPRIQPIGAKTQEPVSGEPNIKATFNATTSTAADMKQKALNVDRSQPLLSRNQNPTEEAIPAAMAPDPNVAMPTAPAAPAMPPMPPSFPPEFPPAAAPSAMPPPPPNPFGQTPPPPAAGNTAFPAAPPAQSIGQQDVSPNSIAASQVYPTPPDQSQFTIPGQ